MDTIKYKNLLDKALRALCLTRDYVGEEKLPAIKGWEWYDSGCDIIKEIPESEWADQFKIRVIEDFKRQLKEKFKDGDWVVGIGEHDGCSQVFTGQQGDFQPFSYLNDYNPINYRLATDKEIINTKRKLNIKD